MAGIDNLTPWKKGQSGNPEGKPRGVLNRSTRLKRLVDLAAQDGFKSMLAKRGPVDDLPLETIEDQVELSLLLAAMAGDMAAIKEFKDTLYGKITEKIENSHTFTQMGRAKIGEKELSFNVGSEVNVTTQEDVEQSPDQS